MNLNFNPLRCITFASMLALPGCIPQPLELDLEPLPTKLVVQGLLLPNSKVAIQISKTYPATESVNSTESESDQDDLLVTNAEVWLLTPLDSVPLEHSENGVYVSPDFDVYSDMQVTVFIQDPVLDLKAQATNYIFDLVDILDLEVKPSKNNSDSNGIIAQLDLLHHTDLKEHYIISCIKLKGESLDQLDSSSSLSYEKFRSEIFADQESTLGRYQIEIGFSDYEMEDTLLFGVSRISDEYYKYLQLRKDGGDLLTELMREAISYPSNVVGGYGFVEFINPVYYLKIGTTRTIKLPEGQSFGKFN